MKFLALLGLLLLLVLVVLLVAVFLQGPAADEVEDKVDTWTGTSKTPLANTPRPRVGNKHAVKPQKRVHFAVPQAPEQEVPGIGERKGPPKREYGSSTPHSKLMYSRVPLDRQHHVKALVNGQELSVLVDTGDSTVWVLRSALRASACPVCIPDSELNCSYADGCAVKGKFASDVEFQLGKVFMTLREVGIADKLDKGQGVQAGILGLAPTSVFWESYDIQSVGFFSNGARTPEVMELNPSDLLCRADQNDVIVTFSPHPGKRDSWFSKAGIEIDGKLVGFGTALWDTGWTLFAAKSYIVRKIIRAVGVSEAEIERRVCPKSKDVIITLHGESGALYISVLDKLLNRLSANECQWLIQPLKDDVDFDVVVGQVVLGSLYTLFRKAHPQQIVLCPTSENGLWTKSTHVEHPRMPPCTVEFSPDGKSVNLFVDGFQVSAAITAIATELRAKKGHGPAEPALIQLACLEGSFAEWQQVNYHVKNPNGLKELGIGTQGSFFLNAGVDRVGFFIHGSRKAKLLSFNAPVDCVAGTETYLPLYRPSNNHVNNRFTWAVTGLLRLGSFLRTNAKISFGTPTTVLSSQLYKQLDSLAHDPDSFMEIGNVRIPVFGTLLHTVDEIRNLFVSENMADDLQFGDLFLKYVNLEFHRPLNGYDDEHVMICRKPCFCFVPIQCVLALFLT